MKIKLPVSDTVFKTIDTKKLYLYNRYVYDHVISPDNKKHEMFIVKPVLKKYMDGEGYGTQFHYGWMFEIVKIIKKHYSWSVGDDAGTIPDLIEHVEEYTEGDEI